MNKSVLCVIPGCKLEPVYPTNHGYISNLAGKKYNLPVTLTGKKIEANMRQNGLWGTIPTILVLNLMIINDEESSESEED